MLLPFCRGSSSLKLVHIRQSGLDLRHYHVGSYAMDPGVIGLHTRYQVHDIRQLGVQFFNFAMWLFGPQGVPSVEALAFGDFMNGVTYSGLSLDHNFVILRNSTFTLPPFRLLDLMTEDGMDFVDRHRQILEACPTEQVLRPYLPK